MSGWVLRWRCEQERGWRSRDWQRCSARGINHLDGPADEAPGGTTTDLLRAWGFTSIGYSAHAGLRRRWPHFQTLAFGRHNQWRPSGAFAYFDPFDRRVVARQRQAVGRRLAKRRPVGCALGVLWNDLPLWDPDRARREQGVSWVEALLDLPAGSPGRERMREGLACAGVGEGELLAEIASRHYRDVSRFAARYAPGLASGGDVLSLHDTPDSVFRVIARFVDFVSVQMGPACSPRPGPGYEAEWNPDRLWRLHHLTGKPVLVADHAVSFPDARGRDTLWHCMPGPAAAGDVYRRFVVGCATLPFVVGYCRCGFRDRYVEGRKLVKQGLLDESGAPHRKLVDRVVEANREACSAFSRR